MQRPDLDFDATPEELVSVEGERLGRYQLRYEIASGGMATVYLARASGPGGFERPIAIKRIHPHLAKKRDFVAMFLDEARVTARIVHPNVCSVFDFGEADGTWFLAMEYLVGQSLAAVLARLSLRPDLAASPRWLGLAARIVADACEGLHAAHELRDETGTPMGVVHRDASPHNVFVTYDGAVKMVDFGVALAEGRSHQTQNRMLKGKLAYMPPEQVRGEPLDRRADVWSIGVCLWELLAVRRLFALSSDAAILEAVARAPIHPPSAFAPAIPARLDAIVLRALSRDVDGRYPTARALGRDLGAFAASTGVGTGLADLAELMEELFHAERTEKLGVVARVLASPSSEWPAESGEHFAGRASTEDARRPDRPRALLGRLDPDEAREAPRERSLIHATPATPVSIDPPSAPPAFRESSAATPQRSASVSGGFRVPPSTPTPLSSPALEVTALVPYPAPPEEAPASRFVAAPAPAPRALATPPPPEAPAMARPAAQPPQPQPSRAWMVAAALVGGASILGVAIAGFGTWGDPPDVRAVSLRAPSTVPSQTIATIPPIEAAPTAPPPVEPIAIAPPIVAPPIEPVVTAPVETEPVRAVAPIDRPAPHEERPRTPRTPPVERPSTDAHATGAVNVAARGGWADIFVGGESRGRTPTRLTLPVGRQVLELRPGDGSPPQRVTVVVREDTVERVVVTLGE